MASIGKLVWSKPVAQNLRSGFEITGYMSNISRAASNWTKPVAQNLRSGFEITGYMNI